MEIYDALFVVSEDSMLTIQQETESVKVQLYSGWWMI